MLTYHMSVTVIDEILDSIREGRENSLPQLRCMSDAGF